MSCKPIEILTLIKSTWAMPSVTRKAFLIWAEIGCLEVIPALKTILQIVLNQTVWEESIRCSLKVLKLGENSKLTTING